MERIPGYQELMTHTEDNFFPDELESYNLTHNDKVLLTLRLIRGVRYEDAILEDLTENGRKAYQDLFQKQEELSTDSLIDILMNVDSIEEIIKLRISSRRFYELTEDAKIIEKLYEKFKKNGTLYLDIAEEFPGSPETFSDFLEWYGMSTLDTEKCDDYHNATLCIQNAIKMQNVQRLQRIIERVAFDQTKLANVRLSILYGKLNANELRYIFEHCRPKKRIFEAFYMYQNDIGQNVIMKYPFIFTDSFFDLATELGIDLSLLFENERNMLLLNSGKEMMVMKNFHKILMWCRDNKKVSAEIFGLEVIFQNFKHALKIVHLVPRTPQNEKIVNNIIYLVNLNVTKTEKSRDWLNENWK